MPRLGVVVTGLALAAGCNTHPHRDTPYVRLVLNKMTIAVKAYAMEYTAFPIGTSRQLPLPFGSDASAKGCCGSMSDGKKVDNKCPVSSDFAFDPIWALLDVPVDEPSFHRFTYDSKDGTSFVITAEGDLDCDGEPGRYTVTGSLDEKGYPVTKLEMPRRVY